MAEGFILAYQTKDEMKKVYKSLLAIKKEWFDILLYFNPRVPYPWTIVIRAMTGMMYDLDMYFVESGIDLGNVDMYALLGREREVAQMRLITEEFMEKSAAYPEPGGGEMRISRDLDTHRVELKKVRDVPSVRLSEPITVQKFVSEMEDYDRERFKIIYLDTKNRVLGVENISEGTINAALIHPREAVKGAVLANSSGVILVHNHPSGIPEPSLEDETIITKLGRAFKLMGIDVTDAMIIGKEGYYSFKLKGRLEALKSGGTEQVMETDKKEKDREEACSIALEAAMSVVKEQCGEGTELDIGVMTPPPEEVMMVREDKELSQEEKIEQVEKSLWARRLAEGWVKAVMSYMKPGTEEFDRAVESMAHKVAVGLVTKAG